MKSSHMRSGEFFVVASKNNAEKEAQDYCDKEAVTGFWVLGVGVRVHECVCCVSEWQFV